MGWSKSWTQTVPAPQQPVPQQVPASQQAPAQKSAVAGQQTKEAVAWWKPHWPAQHSLAQWLVEPAGPATRP